MEVLRGVRDVPLYCSGYIDECDRDRCSFNNGVDNIREIREEVAYRPTEGKYKVYIIDEVHMLSIGRSMRC